MDCDCFLYCGNQADCNLTVSSARNNHDQVERDLCAMHGSCLVREAALDPQDKTVVVNSGQAAIDAWNDQTWNTIVDPPPVP